MTSQLPAGYSVVEDTEQTLPAPQASSAPALPKGYSLVDEPKEQSIANFAKGLATEVAVGGAGQVVGAMTGPGYFVIAPASGAYGNYLKQQQEIERGERNQLSVGEMVASALINTIPGGVATKVGAKVLKAPTAAIGRTVGERTARIGEQAVIRGTEGAVIGAGAKTVETAIEDKRWPTYDEYLNVIKSGAAFGGAVGVGEKVLAPTLSKTASKIWNRFSGKTQQEVSQELTTIRNTGNPEERQAAGEIIDEVGQRMGLVNPRPKSAQESATQFATAVEPRATGAAEESARALLGNEAVEIEELSKIAKQRDSMLSQQTEVQSSRRKAIQQLEMAQKQLIAEQKAAEMAKYQPISEAEKSAAVFEQAFTEGQTQVGAQGLRARLAAEQQAAEIAQKQVPIPPAQQSASVFERAFTEGQTQAGAQGLRARLGGEKQAGIRAEDFDRARDLQDIARQIEAGRLSAPERIPSEAVLRATMVKPAGKIGRSMKTDMPTTEDIIQEFQNVPGVKGRAGALKMGLVGSAAAASTVAAESMGDKGDATVKAPVDAYEIVHPDSRIGTLKYDAKKWNEDSILQDINKKEMELVKIDVAAPSLMIREEWQKVQDSRDRGEITELEAQKKQFDLMREISIKDIGMATAARIGFPLLGEGLTAKRAGGLGRVPGAMIGEAVGSMIEGMPVTAGGVLGAGISAIPGGVKGQFAKNLMKFAGAQLGGEITKEAIDQGELISFKRAAMAAAEGGAGAATMKLMDKAARAVSSQVAKRGNWAVIKTLSGANELGLIVDPTIYRDSWPQSMVMKLAGGSTKFQDAASRINYPRMTEAVEGVLGVPAGTSFDRPFFITTRMELGKSYEKIAAVSKQARSAVDDWKAANESMSVNFKAAASETTPKVRIQYREAAAKAKTDADNAFAVIQTEAYATGKGNLVDDLIESRKQLARMYAIKASVNEFSGKIEYPEVWGEMYQAGIRFDGNLEKLARISAIMPEVLQPPQNMIRQRPLKGAAETKMMQNMMSLPFRAGLAGPQAAALQTMMSRPYQSGAIGDMMSFRTQPGVPAQLGRFLGTEGAEAARPIPYR
jgi:hypothetical protein